MLPRRSTKALMDVLSSRSDRESLRTEALLRRDRDARARGIDPEDFRAMEERRPLEARRREANLAAMNRARGSEEVSDDFCLCFLKLCLDQM
jgi:hypothetical protein